MDASSFAYDLVKDLVLRAVSAVVDDPAHDFFTRRKIKARLEDATAKFVEQLVPFLRSERISEEQQVQLLSTCQRELRDLLLQQPRLMFAGSLDGQKIFDDAYASRPWPEEVAHEPLRHLYSLIFPQIANVLCTFPPALEQWKAEGFREGFRRLDEIAVTLGDIAVRIEALASGTATADATLFARVVQSLAQRVEFKLELTGLRADRPDAVSIEKCFVMPALRPGRRGFQRPTIGDDKMLNEGSDVLSALSVVGSRNYLFGLPGAGKSTFSLWLQRELLTKKPQTLAIHVKLRETARTNAHLSFVELVRVAAGAQLREEITPEIARRWADDGRLYFIFDGFDEVPANGRDTVERWIAELSHAVDKSSLLVTSRPLTTDHLQGKDKRWRPFEMMGFDEARVIEYVEKWYQHAPLLKDADREIDAVTLASTWVNDQLLGPLVATPLTLATLLMVHHLDGKLPQGRAKLYERYVDGMLGIWDQRWGISSAIEMRPAQKKLLLTRLGLHLQSLEREELDDQSMQEFLRDALPKVECSFEPSQVLDHLRERTGLLVGPGTWSFFHKSIAEFFVATAVVDGDLTDTDGARVDRLSLYAHRHEDRWAVVLFFWAGLAAPAELQSFIDMLMKENEEADSLLALSLIHDQVLVHRLPLAWRSPRIKELLRREYPSHMTAGSVYEVPPRGSNKAPSAARSDELFLLQASALPRGLAVHVCVVLTPTKGVGRQLMLHVNRPGFSGGSNP